MAMEKLITEMVQPADVDLATRLNEWFAWDPRPETKEEAAKLLKEMPGSLEELRKRFCKRLEFGTAGLRGPMGAGFNCMNDLTVVQTTQGLCMYLLGTFGEVVCKERGVVLGFDGRYGSKRYANAAAAVFLSKGIKVYLSDDVTPTPFNPYVLVRKSALAGIQVTASHNPKNDNGYKVYADNGAQIIPPMDAHVASLILKNLEPWAEMKKLLDANTGMLLDAKSVQDPEQLYVEYVKEVAAEMTTKKDLISSSNLKIVYTAMHGVGSKWVQKMMDRIGFKNLHPVPEQDKPDPEFPTVSFPNPEEKGALDIAMALADKLGSPMVIANDPDADRFACTEKQKDGKWHIFHGDELGILFGSYCFDLAKERGLKPEQMLFICSAVSSRMLQKMAVTEGAVFEETMTGFKWMMNAAQDLRKSKGLHPILVYEEALGYGMDMRVPDKDGVSASAIWVQMACELYAKGITIAERLDQLRKKYGYFVTNNYYFLCYDKNAITKMFAEFRNGGKYTEKIGDFEIARIRDVTTGFDNGQPDKKCTFPLTPTSQMVTVFFKNGAVITLRTSGTEPKLKWYAEMSADEPTAARAELQKVVDAVIAGVMQPGKYPLETPKAK